MELPPSYAATSNSQQLFPNETSPATVTWVRITTLDPKSSDRRCKNCTIFDYDDPDDHHPDTGPQRRRHKRRRNKKPTSDRRSSWSHRRASGEQPRKKYSTRVHLDKPTKFTADVEEPALVSSTVAPPPTVPPPVRYLLPPFVTNGLDQNQEIATSEWTAGRGSTKFKDTLHDRENELDSLYSSAPSPPTHLLTVTDPTGRAAKSRLRPIVVPPVLDTIANSTDDPTNRGSLEFVSPEAAEAGMKAIAQQPTPAYGRQPLVQSPPPVEWTITQNEQPRRFVEQTTRMPTASWLATESFQPVDISENYILDQSSPFQESKNHETPSRPTPGAFDNNLVYQPTERFVSGAGQIRKFVPSSTTAFRYQYSRQSNRYPENYSSTSATRRTAATVAYNVTSYSPPSNNSGEDSFNGLELAESSYFSELPSHGEVMKLTQTGNF